MPDVQQVEGDSEQHTRTYHHHHTADQQRPAPRSVYYRDLCIKIYKISRGLPSDLCYIEIEMELDLYRWYSLYPMTCRCKKIVLGFIKKT